MYEIGSGSFRPTRTASRAYRSPRIFVCRISTYQCSPWSGVYTFAHTVVTQITRDRDFAAGSCDLVLKPSWDVHSVYELRYFNIADNEAEEEE